MRAYAFVCMCVCVHLCVGVCEREVCVCMRECVVCVHACVSVFVCGRVFRDGWVFVLSLIHI